MSRPIRTMTIANSEEPGRIRLDLFKAKDGYYRWHERGGRDTEISGRTVPEACELALLSWPAHSGWDPRASWIK